MLNFLFLIQSFTAIAAFSVMVFCLDVFWNFGNLLYVGAIAILFLFMQNQIYFFPLIEILREVFYHMDDLIITLAVIIGVFGGLFTFFNFRPIIGLSRRIVSHSKFLEIFWTVRPALRQWYWFYEYVLSLDDIINFEAYLIKTEDST